MKRFHVHVAVDDFDATLRFYSGIFGMAPTVLQPDYAKWLVEDPPLNFAVSKQTGNPGIDHLGVQVDSGEDLALLREQVAGAQIAAQDQPGAACCYAKSDKYWTVDPQGIAWETFHTLESIPIRGRSERPAAQCCGKPAAESPAENASACCA